MQKKQMNRIEKKTWSGRKMPMTGLRELGTRPIAAHSITKPFPFALYQKKETFKLIISVFLATARPVNQNLSSLIGTVFYKSKKKKERK